MESLPSKVTTLEKKVGTLENKVEALESTLLVSQNTSDKLSEGLDKQSAELQQLHQYSRWNCIIVSGIPVKKNETCKDLKRSFEKNVIKDNDNPSDLYYTRKKIKNCNIRLKPLLTKKRTELLHNATERIEDDNTQGTQFVYADFNGNIKVRLRRQSLILRKIMTFEKMQKYVFVHK